MIEGAVLTRGEGRTGIKHVKWHTFIRWSLHGCCRQIASAPRKRSWGLVYEYHNWANSSCGRNTGNASADNTVFLSVSQHKANINYGSSKLLCCWCISPFCLKGGIVGSIFPALLPPCCHLLLFNKYCVPLHVCAQGLARRCWWVQRSSTATRLSYRCPCRNHLALGWINAFLTLICSVL